MAANGFPAGEREGGGLKCAVGAISEPLGDVINIQEGIAKSVI
jgi:hypothetical protein